MASRGKAGKPRKGDALIAQMGLLGGMQPDNDDDDLEAELLMLQGESAPAKSKRKKPDKTVDIAAIQKLANDINLDIGSDEELSGDEADLMKELEGLSSGGEEDMEEEEEPAPKPVVDATSQKQLIEHRLSLYTSAISTVDAAKKRRYDRAIKTLQSQLRTVKMGKTVDPEEIPPEIAVKPSGAPSAAPPTNPNPCEESGSRRTNEPTPHIVPGRSSDSAPRPSASVTQPGSSPSQPAATSDTDNPKLRLLHHRRAEYHKASLEAKHAGDNRSAVKFLKIKKDFDQVIAAVEEGREVDLSNIPPSPTFKASSSAAAAPAASASPSQASAASATREAQAESVMESLPDVSEQDKQTLFHAPDAPTDTLSALEQRYKKYADSEAEAKQQNNSSKARRMGRIAKQYADAIKDFKAGRPVEFSELPTPPGFAEIPLPGSSTAGSVATAAKPPATDHTTTASLAASASPTAAQVPAAAVSPGKSPGVVKPKQPPKRQASLSIQEKQLNELKARQDQYKKAALDAKNHDDKELALKYMRIIKGISPMIQAATNGLPVDISQLPPPPTANHQTGFVTVDESDIAEVSEEDRKAEFDNIIEQLKSQIKTCSDNTANYKKMGDVKNSFVFETLEKNFTKDLDAVQNALRHGEPVPKYHYESKQYTIVKINTDLGDGDLDMSIIRGIQLPLPNDWKPHDLDTYVQYELPWPQDEGQKGKTGWSKHSVDPEYNYQAKLKIDRKSKSMLRIFKNRKLKLELYYHRGFLKSDKHFSTVNIKLDKFESSTTIHDSFDLMDTNGRKEIGGKIEVKLRIREPITQKEVEVINAKWLFIDQLVRLNKPNAQVTHTEPVNLSRHIAAQSQVSLIQSIEVLKFEKKELDTKIREVSKQLSPADLQRLLAKSAQMATSIEETVGMMRKNQLTPQEYLQTLSKLLDVYSNAAVAAGNEGNVKKQRLNTVKRDLVQREIRAWKAKISVS